MRTYWGISQDTDTLFSVTSVNSTASTYNTCINNTNLLTNFKNNGYAIKTAAYFAIMSMFKTLVDRSGLDFIIKNLPSVLIQIIVDQSLNDSLCCPYAYNWYLCTLIGKLYFLLLTLLMNLSEILHEIFWIKGKEQNNVWASRSFAISAMDTHLFHLKLPQ